MSRYCGIIFYYALISCIYSQFSLIEGVVSTKAPLIATKKNGTKKFPTKTGGKIITLRQGVNSNSPEEQCECRLFYLCEKNNTVDTSQNSQSCGENYVCCKIETLSSSTEGTILSSTNDVFPEFETSTLGGSASESSSPIITTNTESTCRCVPTEQCRRTREEQENGVGGIDQRKNQCTVSEWCCPPQNIISGEESGGMFECGMRNSGQDVFSRIVSSHNTSFGEFPWMALLLTAEIINPSTGERLDNVFVCGASLVSSKLVLTAGHCVEDLKDVSLLKVRVGEYDTHAEANKEQKPHQDRQVLRIIQHRSYNSKTLFNDLALVEVIEPFTFDYHVLPICIPLISNPYEYDPSNCVATGWGRTAFGPESPYPTTLKKVDLSIVPNDRCQEELRKTRLGQYFILDPSFLCAGGHNGMDTCEGDGGGPLVCALRTNANRYVQVGIVSWGIGCGTGLPAVYASLEKNLEWLTEEFNAATVFSSSKVEGRKSRS